MRLTVIQTSSGTDKQENLHAARDLAASAVASDHSDALFFPEMVSFLGGSDDDRRTAAEPIPHGETYKVMQEIAQTHGVIVHGGSWYESVDGSDRVCNTSVVFDRTGAELARYRKIHLFDITAPDGTEYRESAVIQPGEQVVDYAVAGLRFGCTICYDLRFGELYRALAERSVDVIAVPAAFTLQTGKDHWEVLLRARAIETESYVVAAAQCGTFPTPEGKRATWGHSMIVDPWGYVIAQVSDGVGYATATVDPKYIETVRNRIPLHTHRVL